METSNLWVWGTATFGGFVVAVGIMGEILVEKKWYADLRSMRRAEKWKKFWELLVVTGVLIETFTAASEGMNEWRTQKSVAYMQQTRFEEPNLRSTLSKFRNNEGAPSINVMIFSSLETESMKASGALVRNLVGLANVEGPYPQIIVSDGIQIESAMEQKSTNDESQAAAFFILQALTDVHEAATMMPGDSKIPENTILIKVGPKPRENNLQNALENARSFIYMFRNSKDRHTREELEVDRYLRSVSENPENAHSLN